MVTNLFSTMMQYKPVNFVANANRSLCLQHVASINEARFCRLTTNNDNEDIVA